MRWCFGDGKPADLAYATKVMESLAQGAALVPSIWKLEVANVLARAEHRKLIDSAHSAAFLAILQDLPIITDPSGEDTVFTNTLQLARQHRLSAYDAAYLELAIREQLPLATLDADLRKAAKRTTARLYV